jgi:DNA repair ATPase RecN
MTLNDEFPNTTEHVNAFLRAEKDATALVAQLHQLRDETVRYTEAHHALEETTLAVSSSATNLGELMARVGDILETLRTIGTPQLLSGQEALADSVSSLSSGVATLEAAVDGLNRTVSDRVADATKQLESVQRDMQMAIQEQQRERLATAEAQQAVISAISRVGATTDATASDLKGLRRLFKIGFAVLLAAVGTVGIAGVLVHP